MRQELGWGGPALGKAKKARQISLDLTWWARKNYVSFL